MVCLSFPILFFRFLPLCLSVSSSSVRFYLALSLFFFGLFLDLNVSAIHVSSHPYGSAESFVCACVCPFCRFRFPAIVLKSC